MERGNVSQAEEPIGIHDTSSTTSEANTQKTTEQTFTADGKGLPCAPQAAGSTKRKLSHAKGFSELRRSERLTKRART
jgi:hypothetical protein